MDPQQKQTISWKKRHTKKLYAMTKAASADLTHDLKPRRLPLFQPDKTIIATAPPPFPPAPPVFTKWLQTLVIATAKTPINPPIVSSSTSSSLLSDLGPLGSAQRHGCLSVKRRHRTERGPYWLLFSSTEWHYWNPNPAACMCGGNRLTPVLLACLPEKTRWGTGGGLRNVLMHYQTSCFHWAVCKKGSGAFASIAMRFLLGYKHTSNYILFYNSCKKTVF